MAKGWGRTNIVVAVLIVGLTATGCATPEWLAENDLCRGIWTSKIPEIWQQRLVERTRYEDVPDGNIKCSSTAAKDGKTTRTHCTQGKRRIWIPYTTVESFDLNAPARQSHVNQCIAENCVRKYGNAACKIG